MSNIVSIAQKKEGPNIETHMGLSQHNKVIGLDGKISEKPLTYLDSTATALAEAQINREIKSFLKDGYANTHTTGHHRGRDSTEAVNAARHSVGEFMGYDPKQDMVIFNGTGATGPLNYLAQVLFPKSLRLLNNPGLAKETKDKILETLSPKEKRMALEMMEKPIVITTEMEHHANQLPWFDNENIKIVPVNGNTGELDLDVLKVLLEKHKWHIRLVTVSGASNVTGIMNPIYDIARMAHDAGAEICVDGAQLTPHHKIEKRRPDPWENLDYIVMSPHKFGVPNTPGVLVANRSLLDGRRNLVNLGGGMVNVVTAFPPDFTPIPELDAGEEPGTPNVPGIIAVGLAAAHLTKNMTQLEAHEKKLTQSLMAKLKRMEKDGVQIIGAQEPEKRVGVVSFLVKDVAHEVVTAYLNDHWNIAVRNGCFCAHPFMIKTSGATQSDIEKIRSGDHLGMFGYVRASFGEHSLERDVETLVEALTELVQNKQKVNDLYTVDSHGNAARKDGFRQPKGWSFEEAVERNAIAEKMQAMGFEKKEIKSLLPVFQGSKLLPLLEAHNDCKRIALKVNEGVNKCNRINGEDKVSACRDILLNIYNADALEKGENAARARNRPVYKSGNGEINTATGWEQAVTSMVNAKYPLQEPRVIGV